MNTTLMNLYRPLIIALTVCLGAPLSTVFAAEIERVEPPNWWTGFNEPDVRLLVYGDGVGELRPAVDYPGVTVLDTLTTENPNYLFVRLRIAADAEPGEFDIEFNGDGDSIAYPYRLDARNPDPGHTRGFSSRDAIYLITPDRFANSDPGNDEIEGLGDIVDRNQPGARHGGDIKGIIDRLDYIAGLGFTAVWLNPVLENAMPSFSYHGYATTDFYRVDSRMGSNADLAELARAGREKGVGLIMDMIVNHSGLHHWWMDDPPMDDWVHRWDGYVETNHAKTLSVDPYAAEVDRRELYDGWFVPDMPDLNQDNPLMAEYLIQNAIWWIETADLSGIRVDTWSYADKGFLSDWTRRVMTEYPDFNVVGEEWNNNPGIIAYWQRGKARDDGYESHLPSLMDFPLQIALGSSLSADETWNTGIVAFYRALVADFLYADPSNLLVFADNHDMHRIYRQLDGDDELFRLAMVLVLTTRGIPQILYGTEILMDHPPDASHGVMRVDFPGGWPGDEVNGFTGEGLSKDAAAAQDFMRRLLNWRKTSKAVTEGRLIHYAPADGIYVYFRQTEDLSERIMVAINKNADDAVVDLNRFAESLYGANLGFDVLTGQPHGLGQSLTIPGRAFLILDVQ